MSRLTSAATGKRIFKQTLRFSCEPERRSPIRREDRRCRGHTPDRRPAFQWPGSWSHCASRMLEVEVVCSRSQGSAPRRNGTPTPPLTPGDRKFSLSACCSRSMRRQAASPQGTVRGGRQIGQFRFCVSRDLINLQNNSYGKNWHWLESGSSPDVTQVV